MTRVVIDTNVLVSALLVAAGAEAAVINLIVEGTFIWCVSEPILAEYELVLNRPKFRKIEQWKTASALALAKTGDLTVITSKVRRSAHEPLEENENCECA